MEQLPATIKTSSLAMAAALARRVPNECGGHRRCGEDGWSQAGAGDAFGAGSVALHGRGTLGATSSPLFERTLPILQFLLRRRHLREGRLLQMPWMGFA